MADLSGTDLSERLDELEARHAEAEERARLAEERLAEIEGDTAKPPKHPPMWVFHEKDCPMGKIVYDGEMPDGYVDSPKKWSKAFRAEKQAEHAETVDRDESK